MRRCLDLRLLEGLAGPAPSEQKTTVLSQGKRGRKGREEPKEGRTAWRAQRGKKQKTGVLEGRGDPSLDQD